jgi:hypothetical protein
MVIFLDPGMAPSWPGRVLLAGEQPLVDAAREVEVPQAPRRRHRRQRRSAPRPRRRGGRRSSGTRGRPPSLPAVQEGAGWSAIRCGDRPSRHEGHRRHERARGTPQGCDSAQLMDSVGPGSSSSTSIERGDWRSDNHPSGPSVGVKSNCLPRGYGAGRFLPPKSLGVGAGAGDRNPIGPGRCRYGLRSTTCCAHARCWPPIGRCGHRDARNSLSQNPGSGLRTECAVGHLGPLRCVVTELVGRAAD